MFRTALTLAGKRLLIESDEDSIAPHIFICFGRDDGRSDASPPFLHASIRQERSELQLGVTCDGRAVDADALLFGLDQPDCPYVRDGSTIAFRENSVVQFTTRGDRIVVHETGVWREALTTLLARNFRRLSDDTIFFHASAAAIGEKGLLVLGRQNAGKSTIALALAARGHDFLSDEFGCYDPRTHELVPYRRPVGIRSGPRAAAIERALARGGFFFVEEADSMRVDLASLLKLEPERRAVLHAVLFIDGFTERPSLRHVDPGRREVGLLQTLYSSFINASTAQRAFELVRLLSRSRVAYLTIGDPDETAALLEEEFER